MDHSQILNNTSNLGGGLFIADAARLHLINNSISNNTADQAAGIFAGHAASYVAVDGSFIRNNTAERYGGGVLLDMLAGLNISGANSSISENTAGISGGGVFANSPNFDLNQVLSVVSKNQAPYSADLASMPT